MDLELAPIVDLRWVVDAHIPFGNSAQPIHREGGGMANQIQEIEECS